MGKCDERPSVITEQVRKLLSAGRGAYRKIEKTIVVAARLLLVNGEEPDVLIAGQDSSPTDVADPRVRSYVSATWLRSTVNKVASSIVIKVAELIGVKKG
jgi:hypothetical protein